MNKRLPRLLIPSILLFGTLSAAADVKGISHEPLGCLPVQTSARVVAALDASVGVSSARVYFRPEADVVDYFVEMRRGAGEYWVGFLPAAESTETSMVYRIEVRDGDSRVLRTVPAKVKASAGCPMRMSIDEARMAKNLVLGFTSKAQPAVPAGFSAVGIVARITPEGELMTLPPGVVASASPAVVSPLASRTGPSPACAGCGTLTIGGTSTVEAGDCGVVGGCGPPPPTPPPVSRIR